MADPTPASSTPSPKETAEEKRVEEYALARAQARSGRGWRRGGFIAAVLVGLAIALSLLSRTFAERRLQRQALASATQPVNIVYPSPIKITEEISLPGSAQALQDTSIYARTSGYLKSWNVDIGAHVQQGELLAEIETPEVDRQLEQARADLKNAQANLELAQITGTRSVTLFKNNTISSQERDQAQSDLAAKRALADAGQANVHRLEQLQSFEKIYAPFAGVITARNTDIGALIQAGDNSARELFHLVDNQGLRIYFSVPEVYAAGVQIGQKIPITFDAFAGEKYTGTLVRDAAAIDPKTHTLMAEADVENPTGRLFTGGYATVHLKLPARKGGVTLPSNTLLFRSEGTRVGVVRGGRAVLVPIAIGSDHGNTIEVLEGLTPQDPVILDPPDSLADGAAVQIESPAAPPAS